MASKESNSGFADLKERILGKTGKEYWRSVEEFVDAPEFEEYVKQEYPVHAKEWDDTLSRRNFVKVMGASLAFAGLSGCVIQPAEKIVPYVRQPEGVVPGKPLFFATAMSLGGVANGVLARSNDGRPTKLEGNPEHPGSLGATDVLTQASLLGLYDPDRSKEILYRATPKTWQSFLNAFRAKVDELRADGGSGIRILTETVTSPSLVDQIERITAELPNAKLVQYEPVNDDNSLRGAKMAFGEEVRPVYDFENADRVLSLDADIFSGFNVRNIKDFSKRRSLSVDKTEMNRLYAVETSLSLTGAKADHRLAVRPSRMALVVREAAKAIGVEGVTNPGIGEEEKKWLESKQRWITEMAKDLAANKGRSLVVVGANQPAEVHALACAINDALGNVGKTVKYIEPFQPDSGTSQTEQLAELIRDIDAGNVKMLVIAGGNPVYTTPEDLKLSEERMRKVGFRVHCGEYVDETGILCQWHVSATHFLETWGDVRAFDGTVSITQPLIKPLYESRSVYEVLQLFFKDNYEKTARQVVREFWQKEGLAPDGLTAETNGGQASTEFEDAWRKIVHDGYMPGTASASKEVTLAPGFLEGVEPAAKPAGKLEMAILPDPCVYDGRFANNGWLQELPNPLNKVTWENVALISPDTAQRLGINQDKRYKDYAGGELGRAFITTKGGNLSSDLLELTYQGNKLKEPVPAWISPGQPDDVVTVFLGYGRTRAGRVGTGIGYDAYGVRRSNAMWFGSGDIRPIGEQTQVASTQIHFNMEKRDLLRNLSFEEYEGVLEEEPEDPAKGYEKSMYGNVFGDVYEKHHKWAMTIDLNSCVGCNACVIACQSENNIPVVGKEQVERSREMQWMRVDAYYQGDVSDPEGPHFQPVLCQQCEQAPCEVVCPVHATVHSAEGLNDMVYNRCVGTRYCSNNCPYKVRRFNFLLYQDWDTPQYKLMRNPEVTVRSRGVMEKCTYCTQRISAARIEAEREGREIRDGEVVTACQAVCPADAIVFGNMHDKDSLIAKTKQDHRNYSLLNEELNTQPRTTYLSGVRNQNKAMPDHIPPKKKNGAKKH